MQNGSSPASQARFLGEIIISTSSNFYPLLLYPFRGQCLQRNFSPTFCLHGLIICSQICNVIFSWNTWFHWDLGAQKLHKKHTFASNRLSETSSCWIRPCKVSSFSSHTHEKRLRKRDVCVMKWLMKAMMRFWLIASTWKQKAKQDLIYTIYKYKTFYTYSSDSNIQLEASEFNILIYIIISLYYIV